MANLLDAIRGNSVQPMGVDDETRKLQNLLRAKSGKAASGGAVASSNLGEQQAVTDTNLELGQVQSASNLQQKGIEQASNAETQQVEAQKSEIAQNRRFDTVQNRIKTDAMLREFEQNKGRIDLARDKSRVEQLGFQIRLQDKQYTDQLQREGDRARLMDASEFRRRTAQEAFGQNEAVLRKLLGNKEVLDVNDREFAKAMARMSVDDAWAMFAQEASAAKTAAGYVAAGNTISAGTKAYADLGDRKQNNEAGVKKATS